MLLSCSRQIRAGPIAPDPDRAAVLACLQAEAPAAAAAARAAGGNLRYGAQVRWMRDAEACLGAMLSEVRAAEERLWLELTDARPGVVWDTVLTALRQRAARGVDVHLILGPGCRLPGVRSLRHMRIRCARRGPFAPGGQAILIDDRVCYAGAIALRDDWAGLRSSQRPWIAPCLRLEGDAATAFGARFAAYLQDTAAQAPPAEPRDRAPGYCYVLPLGGAALRRAVLSMIHRAEDNVWLLTPRPGPDPAVAAALRLADRSGAEVHVLSGCSRAVRGVSTLACTGGQARTLACCVDGALAVVGGHAGGIWLYGDAAAGLEAFLARTAARCRAV